VTKIGELGTTQAATSNLVAACVVPSSPIFVTLMKEAPGSSETSVLTRSTLCNIPEDTILHSHLRENLKSYTDQKIFIIVTAIETSQKTVLGPYIVSLYGETDQQ
jgi:hypothetical protein